MHVDAVRDEDRPRVEMWSEFILNSILYGCERLLDGRYTDVDELAGFLARDAVRLVEGELRWYGRLPDPPAERPVEARATSWPERHDG